MNIEKENSTAHQCTCGECESDSESDTDSRSNRTKKQNPQTKDEQDKTTATHPQSTKIDQQKNYKPQTTDNYYESDSYDEDMDVVEKVFPQTGEINNDSDMGILRDERKEIDVYPKPGSVIRQRHYKNQIPKHSRPHKFCISCTKIKNLLWKLDELEKDRDDWIELYQLKRN